MNKGTKRKKPFFIIHHSLFPREAGQTLIEVVAGIGLLMIVVTALIGMGVVALKTSTSARNQTIAAKLASEEMELVRAFRDESGLSALGTGCSSQCHIDLTSPLSIDDGHTEEVQTDFIRYFTLTDEGGGKLKIVATVEWEESSGTKSASVTSYLTDWR